MKVAILLASYNGEKYIEEQIQSLLDQTFKDIFIFIRDDGSSDKTFEIEKKYDKVILITEDDLNIKLTNNMIAVKV